MNIKIIFLSFFIAFNFIAMSCSSKSSTEQVLEEVSNPIEDNQNHEEPEDQDIDGDSQNIVYRILPLGDSRVQGNRPDDESYRFELWKLLLTSNIDFDFVGTKRDLAEYPLFQNIVFDPDHEGTGGATAESLLSELDEILTEVDSDIVLLGIGGNDLDDGVSVSSTIENINAIVGELQSKNSNIIIILEQIAPAISSYMTMERTEVLNEFNSAISNVAQNQTTSTSLVVAVNMFEDWKDEYLADDVHYNENGAKEVANRYFRVIDSLLAQ
jgi:hypothetical protein